MQLNINASALENWWLTTFNKLQGNWRIHWGRGLWIKSHWNTPYNLRQLLEKADDYPESARQNGSRCNRTDLHVFKRSECIKLSNFNDAKTIKHINEMNLQSATLGIRLIPMTDLMFGGSWQLVAFNINLHLYNNTDFSGWIISECVLSWISTKLLFLQFGFLMPFSPAQTGRR